MLKTAFFGGSVSQGQNFKEIVYLGPKKSIFEVSVIKWRVFSDLGIKFRVNVTKLSIFHP